MLSPTHARPLVVLLAACSTSVVLFTSGCWVLSEPVPVPPPSCVDARGGDATASLCESDRDCVGGVCVDADADPRTCGECVAVSCTNDAQCSAPRDSCDVARALCVADACDEVSPCAEGTTCVSTVDGALCERPPLPARCAITPARGILVDGVPVSLDVIGEDGDGAAVAIAAVDAVVEASATGEGAALDEEVRDAPFVTAIPITPRCAAGRCAGVVRVEVGAVDCEAALIVLAPPAADRARVVVLDEADESGIAQAQVSLVLADGAALELATDDDGVAESGAIGEGALRVVTVRASGYAATTIVSPVGRDLVIALSRVPRASLIAGATGTIDASHVIAPADIVIGAAGLPFANLEGALRADRLFGRARVSFLDLGAAEPTPFVSFTGGTLTVGTQEAVPRFAIESEPGRRFAWAFIAAVQLSALSPWIAEVPERGPLFPAIELVRAMDERATFGLSRAVSTTWVERPDQHADYVDAGLADVGAVTPDVFTASQLDLVVPPLPVAHDAVLLLALADTPHGAVVLGARYLEDTDGDGAFDDDARPIASGHTLFYAPPARALTGRALTFAILAIARVELEEGLLGETRVFRTEPAPPPADAPFVVAEAFPVGPSASLGDDGALVAAGIAGELRLTFALPGAGEEDADEDAEDEALHHVVLGQDAAVDVDALVPSLAGASLVQARASEGALTTRAGTRPTRTRTRDVSATTLVNVSSP